MPAKRSNAGLSLPIPPAFLLECSQPVWPLALAGGGVDAVMILGFQVLTAAQTGNTILFAAALARGDLATGLSAGLSALAFVAGAALGSWMLGSGSRNTAKTLGFEAFLLACVLLLWRTAGSDSPAANSFLVAGAAFAMGLQSAAMAALHSLPTTYMTGLLTAFSHDLVASLLPRTRCPATPDARPPSSAKPAWRQGLTWLVYFLGALLSGWSFLRFGEGALLIPILSVLGATLLSRRSTKDRPLPADSSPPPE